MSEPGQHVDVGAPVLELRALEKVFVSGWVPPPHGCEGGRQVNLRSPPVEAVGLVGESGSGKSTVARLIARLVRPTAGQILLNGRDVRGSRAPPGIADEYRHQVQMIFQDPFSSLNPVHTVATTLGGSLQIHHTLDERTTAGRAVAELLDAWAWARSPASQAGSRTSCPAGSASGPPSPGRWPPGPS